MTMRDARNALRTVGFVSLVLVGGLVLSACTSSGSADATDATEAGSASAAASATPLPTAGYPGEKVAVQGLSVVLPGASDWEVEDGVANDTATVRRWVRRPAQPVTASTPTATPAPTASGTAAPTATVSPSPSSTDSPSASAPGSPMPEPSASVEPDAECIVLLSVEHSTTDFATYKEMAGVLLAAIKPTVVDDPAAPSGTQGLIATGEGPQDPANTAAPFTSVLRAFLTPKGTLAKVSVVAPRPATPDCTPETIAGSMAWDGSEFVPSPGPST